MSEKVLFVSSEVQKVLMEQVLIPEFIDGFWKNHRPAGHGDVWREVQVKVAEPDGNLGPIGFESPRNYNVLNLDFFNPHAELFVEAAQTKKPTSNIKSVKKELIELGQIIGGRLKARDGTAVKLFRGNHKPGTVTVSSARARSASSDMAASAAEALTITSMLAPQKPATVKKTVVKKKVEDGVTVSVTAQGATVRRVAVSSLPVLND